MRVFIAFGGLLAATGVACAADLPAPLPAPPPRAPAAFVAPQPYSWTGFYVGANAGGTFVNVNDTATITGTLLGNATATSSGNATGAVAGGQLGFNYQIGPAVVGLEGDFDYSSISKTSNTAGIISETSKIQWLSTIRGRGGFAVDRLLVYATGGVAFVPTSDLVTATGFGTIYSASSVNVGWTAGGGIEGALLDNWTIRAEYLYVRSNFSLNGGLALIGGNGNITGTISDNIVRAGFNFKYP
jgi:outer membrane immunogenic protein